MKISRLFKAVICLLLCFSLLGCKQSIDSSKTMDYSEVELSNVQNDYELIQKAEDIYETNMKKADTNTQKQVVTVKYLDDVYQIASNRVNLDLEILDAFSDKYMDYVATMQAYSEIYLEERNELVSNSKLTSISAAKDTDSGKMLEVLQGTVKTFSK